MSEPLGSVTSEATPELLELFRQDGQTFEQATAPLQQVCGPDRRETPGSAASVARAAKARQPLLT